MKKRTSLLLDFPRILGILVLTALIIPQQTMGQEARPNIIFFYIDDLGWKDLSCYGSAFYETPSIDQLARDGMMFTSAYQAAARCVPSRTSLFTGKYHERAEISDRLGVVPEEYTFAEAFQDQGYHTFFTGKWHLGKDSTRWPQNQGFDVNRGGCDWGAPNGDAAGGGRYFSPYDCPTLEDGPEGEYLTDRLTQETIDFITDHQAREPNQPFMGCVFHYAVHTPIEAPESTVAFYREKLERMEYKRPVREVDGPATTKLRQDHVVYAGMIASVDESVRRIRQTLEDLGIADNTIIVFSTDHGGLSTTLKPNGREISTSNYPLRTGKGWLYEGGIRSPLIVYWPGTTKPGSVTGEPVINMDIYPTLLEMAGIPLVPDQHKDGQSFAPLLKGEHWIRSAPLMWYFPFAKEGTGNPNMAALRVDKHKLIHFLYQDRYELYDLEEDLGESHDLLKEQPLIAEEMKQTLAAMLEDAQMPPPAARLITHEEEVILPEYPVSISAVDYPSMEVTGIDPDHPFHSLDITVNIVEKNEIVHPVDLEFYFRIEGTIDWVRITGIKGNHYRLLPGTVVNKWKYGDELLGKTVDVKISAGIHNALFPVDLGEEIIRGIQLSDQPLELPLPEGRRLREIVKEKYADGQLLIGGTTGSWAFGTPDGRVMDREFSYVTPENDFKQSTIRRKSNTWDWSHADAWLEHIIQHDQVLRIHGPISPQCSRWAKEDSRTPAELETELDTFLTALCKRYNGSSNIAYLDVVNETVTRSGKWMGPKPGTDEWENPWTQIGFEKNIPDGYPHLDSIPRYIIQAFEIANVHAPDLKLVLNQHGGMEAGMWEKIKDLIRYLRNEKGLRVDAVGWQAHLETGWELENNNLEQLEMLVDWCQQESLEFHITEFDAWIFDKAKHDLEDQARTYAAVLKVLIQKSAYGRIGWNTWHISDATGWKVDRIPALFDAEYHPKPSYYAVQRLLEQGNQEMVHDVDVHLFGSEKDSVYPLADAWVLLDHIPNKTDGKGQVSFKSAEIEALLIGKKKAIIPGKDGSGWSVTH